MARRVSVYNPAGMSSGLSIVHVLTSLGIGGGERVALDLATRQRDDGHSVAVVSLDADPSDAMAPLFAERNLPLARIAKRGRGIDPTLSPRLGWFFRRRRAQVVHTHNPLPLIYAGAPARALGARVVHTKHGENRASSRSMVLRRLAARTAHAFVAVSDATAEQALSQRDCSPARLSVIPNGVDLERFGPDPQARRAVRDELGISETAWVVGAVGRVIALKNHALLLRSLRDDLGTDCHVIVAGDGPLLEELRTLAAGHPSIHLLGMRKDVPRVLTALDVFALPSRTEGLPLVVLEAMATGLPIVCTNVGGLPRVVEDGAMGRLVPSDDQAALTAALREQATDPAAARERGQYARTMALSRYSYARMVDAYMQLYQS